MAQEQFIRTQRRGGLPLFAGYLSLALVNMGLAEQKGRSKWKYGFFSLFGGPLVTAFIVFAEPLPYKMIHTTTTTETIRTVQEHNFNKDQPQAQQATTTALPQVSQPPALPSK